MALQRAINTSRVGNIAFGTSYARVVTASFTRPRGGGTKFMIDVAVYATQPTNEDVQEIDFLRYHGDLADLPAGGNPINRAYEYLKTLPEFGGAVDV